MASVAVLYLHMTWDYKAQRPLQIKKLHEGTPISINDPYDVNLGKAQRYFCCRCGYPCRRKPEDDKKMVNRAGKRAFFTHDNIPDHPYCKFRTEQSDGQRFSSEITGNQIVEDEHKTIVSSWCSLIEEQELSNDTENEHRGTIEDDWGPLAGTPIMCHIGLKELRERKIHSVQYIAWHLHDFLDRDIQLPGCNTYSLFQDVFFHASQTAGLGLNTSALFWGQVQKFFSKGSIIVLPLVMKTIAYI